MECGIVTRGDVALDIVLKSGCGAIIRSRKDEAKFLCITVKGIANNRYGQNRLSWDKHSRS